MKKKKCLLALILLLIIDDLGGGFFYIFWPGFWTGHDTEGQVLCLSTTKTNDSL